MTALVISLMNTKNCIFTYVWTTHENTAFGVRSVKNQSYTESVRYPLFLTFAGLATVTKIECTPTMIFLQDAFSNEEFCTDEFMVTADSLTHLWKSMVI